MEQTLPNDLLLKCLDLQTRYGIGYVDFELDWFNGITVYEINHIEHNARELCHDRYVHTTLGQLVHELPDLDYGKWRVDLTTFDLTDLGPSHLGRELEQEQREWKRDCEEEEDADAYDKWQADKWDT